MTSVKPTRGLRWERTILIMGKGSAEQLLSIRQDVCSIACILFMVACFSFIVYILDFEVLNSLYTTIAMKCPCKRIDAQVECHCQFQLHYR